MIIILQKNCWGNSKYFLSVSRYLKLNGFLNFLGRVPHIFDPFPLFSKTFKISICWSVSSNRSVSSYFLYVSSFSKTLKLMFSLNFDRFPQILGLFPYVPSKEKLFVFPKILKVHFGFMVSIYICAMMTTYHFFFITVTYSSYKLKQDNLKRGVHICDIWTRRRGSFLWHNWHLLTHTDQPIEIFKVFEKSGNGSKI